MTIDLRDAFFEIIAAKAEKDPDFIIISSDMEAFSLKKFQNDFPNRYINVGVAEQNAINIAAGLASTGKKVLVFGILSFISTRCYEQIKLNICAMKLPVLIVGIGPGVSFSFDGPTHHATNDITLMRQLPELRILNPNDEFTAGIAANLCLDFQYPTYLRLDKGQHFSAVTQSGTFLNGVVKVKKSDKNLIIFTGTTFDQLNRVIDKLGKNSDEYTIINLVQITPISEELIRSLQLAENIIVVEENTLSGGIFNLIAEIIVSQGLNPKVEFLTLQSQNLYQYGTRQWLFENNLNASNMLNQ
jgi:transketolase